MDVTFFDEEIFNKISEMEEGEFDSGDLCSGFEKKTPNFVQGQLNRNHLL